MTNKKLGNNFENKFSEILFQHGFWVHLLNQNSSGQPADVIAVKNHKAYLIDCKVCSGKGFKLDRVESNQNMAMDLWKSCGNGEGWFAVQINEQIFMIPHFSIKALSYEKSLMNEKDIYEYGTPIGKWLVKK